MPAALQRVQWSTWRSIAHHTRAPSRRYWPLPPQSHQHWDQVHGPMMPSRCLRPPIVYTIGRPLWPLTTLAYIRDHQNQAWFPPSRHGRPCAQICPISEEQLCRRSRTSSRIFNPKSTTGSTNSHHTSNRCTDNRKAQPGSPWSPSSYTFCRWQVFPLITLMPWRWTWIKASTFWAPWTQVQVGDHAPTSGTAFPSPWSSLGSSTGPTSTRNSRLTESIHIGGPCWTNCYASSPLVGSLVHTPTHHGGRFRLSHQATCQWSHAPTRSYVPACASLFVNQIKWDDAKIIVVAFTTTRCAALTPRVTMAWKTTWRLPGTSTSWVISTVKPGAKIWRQPIGNFLSGRHPMDLRSWSLHRGQPCGDTIASPSGQPAPFGASIELRTRSVFWPDSS